MSNDSAPTQQPPAPEFEPIATTEVSGYTQGSNNE